MQSEARIRKESRKRQKEVAGWRGRVPFVSSLPEEAWLLPSCRVFVTRSYLGSTAKIIIHWLTALVVRTFYWQILS